MVLIFMTRMCMCVSSLNLSCVCVRACQRVWVWCALSCLYWSLHTQSYHITTLCNMQNVSYVSFHIEPFVLFYRDVGNFTHHNGLGDV